MSDSKKPNSNLGEPQHKRAVREPVASIWADLLPSEPELDDFEFDALHLKDGPRTSPALTSSLEISSSIDPSVSIEAKLPAGDVDQDVHENLKFEEAIPFKISDEFDHFEALDEGLSAERLKIFKEARASRLAEKQALEEELSHLSESAERFTDTSFIPREAKQSWLIRFPALWSAIFLILLIVLTGEILISTPLLEVTELSIEVQGIHVTQEKVNQIFREGGDSQNIFTFDDEGFKQRLESLPWVKKAEVTRSFPSTLKIMLQEHEASGIVVFRKLYAVNARGELLATVTPAQATSLPLISGIPQELFSDLEHKEVGQFLIRRGLKIANLYHELELDVLKPLSEVHVAETGYVELILKQTRVTLGNEDFEHHLEDLRELLLALKRKGVDAHYILLSSDFTRAIIKEAPLRVDDEVVEP